MSSSLLPQWKSFTKSSHDRKSRHHHGFFHSFNSIPGMGIFFGFFFMVGLIFCMTLFSSHGPLLPDSSESYELFQLDISSTQHPSTNMSTPTNHTSSESSLSDVLSLEQIRDVVATTRGFFSRDYSLNLGWNNVSIRDDRIQAELMIPK